LLIAGDSNSVQARALWQLNRFEEALSTFEKAVRKYPQNLVALVAASRRTGCIS